VRHCQVTAEGCSDAARRLIFHEQVILFHEIELYYKEQKMANLQIKGIQEELYAEIKHLAAAEHRSVAQQILFLVKDYLAKKEHLSGAKTPAQVLLELAGAWADARDADQIIAEIKAARKRSTKLAEGF
jgi:hypothetical protein